MTRGSQLETFRTGDTPAPARMNRWNEFVSDTFAVMSITPDDPRAFSATLSRVQIGDLGLSWYETTASHGEVDVGGAGRWSAPVNDAFLLIVQEAGTARGHHLGREIVTTPGDMVLLDASQPWRVDSDGAMKVIAIKVPAKYVLGFLPDPQAACGVRLSIEQPKMALASNLLRTIKLAVEADPGGDWNEHYADLLLGVIRTLFDARPAEQAQPAISGNQRRDACAFVERHFSDPGLSVGAIAAALGTSTRSVQRIFADLGYTPRRYILERRLTAVADRLRRPDTRHLSITDIALAAGFNDLSHFTHSFRTKWGMAPRAYRAAHRLTNPAG